MEFLKELFGDEALTFEQLGEKLKGAGKDGRDIKLIDLSQGGHIGIEKFNAKETAISTLQEQLDAANKAIDDFKGMDIDSIKTAADEYKKQAEQAQADATAKEQAANYRVAAIEAASGISFSSNSAKQAFIDSLVKKALPLDDGKITGFADFEAQYKEADPGAFKSDTPAPQFAAPGNPPEQTTSWRDKIAQNYKAAKAEKTQ